MMIEYENRKLSVSQLSSIVRNENSYLAHRPSIGTLRCLNSYNTYQVVSSWGGYPQHEQEATW